MADVTLITDHADRAADRLTGHIKGGTFELLVRKIAERYQTLENELFGLIAGRQLANAAGFTLDQIGKLNGVERPVYGAAATDDNAYRVLIYGQIAGNISYGTAPDLYNILGALQFTEVRLLPVYPASYTVSYKVNPTVAEYLTPSVVRGILVKASHPIDFDITAHNGEPFGFEGNLTTFGFDVGKLGDGA